MSDRCLYDVKPCTQFQESDFPITQRNGCTVGTQGTTSTGMLGQEVMELDGTKKSDQERKNGKEKLEKDYNIFILSNNSRK